MEVIVEAGLEEDIRTLEGESIMSSWGRKQNASEQSRRNHPRLSLTPSQQFWQLSQQMICGGLGLQIGR